jgi:hypothetical protein
MAGDGYAGVKRSGHAIHFEAAKYESSSLATAAAPMLPPKAAVAKE